MSNEQNMTRLDAVQSAFFQRELETIDSVVYPTVYPKYKATGFIPLQPGVSPYDSVYTYRMTDTTGEASYMGAGANDAKPSNAFGAETSTLIKDLQVFYHYNLLEIQKAAKQGTPLDQMRAMAAKQAMDEKIDRLLSIGDSSVGITGLLTASGTSTVATGTFWGDLTSADPDRVAGDLLAVLNKGVEATDEAFNRFMLVLPLSMYNLIAQLKISDVSNTTVLQYVKQVSPYVEDIQPWFRCEAGQAGDSTHNIICAFPRDLRCVAGIVPRPLEFLAPQQEGFDFKRYGHASCGGTILRYPKAVTIMQVATS